MVNLSQAQLHQVYSKRYSKNLYPSYGSWGAFSVLKLRTYKFCSFPSCRKRASTLHHAAYLNENGKPIGENGIMGVHFYPLCDRHHNDRESRDCVHHPNHWDKGVLPPPRLDAMQKSKMHNRLKKGFKKLYSKS